MGTDVKVLHVTQEFMEKGCVFCPFCAYVAVDVEMEGRVFSVGCMLGAKQSNHENATLCGLQQYLTAWYADGADWFEVGTARDVVLSALEDDVLRLWREVVALRATKDVG
jgi:hypothetical protein